MSLTGLPLLVLSLTATVGALVLVVAGWRRLRRFRVPGRTLSIVLCEVLALASLGLAVNRWGDFYPSWTALLGGVATRSLAHASSTNLAHWLVARAAQGERDGFVFTWKPAVVSSWHLDEAPIVYVPPAYFQRATSSFPVALVVAPAALGAKEGAWDDRGVSRLVHSTAVAAIPAIVVFVRAALPADATSLGAGLPATLDRDLRVTAHSWAIIGIGAQAPAALEVYAHEAGRFSFLGLLAEGSAPLPASVLERACTLAVGSSVLTGGGAAPPFAAGGEPPPFIHVVVERPESRLATTLAWAYPLMPLAVAAPLLADLPPTPLPSS